MPVPRKDQFAWQSGCYYRIYNRGAHRQTLFREETNYCFVLRNVKKYCRELQLGMVAYCLMPNHYHFLIRQNGDYPAGLPPQRVFNSYSKAYNKKYSSSGTLFEGRWWSIPSFVNISPIQRIIWALLKNFCLPGGCRKT